MKISLLTGGGEGHYQLGLLSGLLSANMEVEVIGSDKMEGAEILNDKRIRFYNLRGSQDHLVPLKQKIVRILKYYYRLIKYAARTESRIFHIQWLNKFIFFDRTLLNIYYKLLGKKLIFTAHNIDAKAREGGSSWINRSSLQFMYKIMDHIIVHTDKAREDLINDFHIKEDKISVVPHGINIAVRTSNMTPLQARDKIGVSDRNKVLLFFGNITPYKGLEYLLEALLKLIKADKDYKLIIAGRIKECYGYWKKTQGLIKKFRLEDYIIERIEYIPDDEVEVYFKAADLLVLPYKAIYQSGLIFLAYNFGLPIIATDVGSFRKDIVEGKTGFICKSENSEDLAGTIELYFQSDLYKNLIENRKEIINYAKNKYSWERIGRGLARIYSHIANEF